MRVHRAQGMAQPTRKTRYDMDALERRLETLELTLGELVSIARRTERISERRWDRLCTAIEALE